MLQRSILVCDTDPAFLAAIAGAPVINNVSLLGAKTAVEAQHAVANRQNRLAAICRSPAVSANRNAIPLLRFCHEHRPATPISFLSDDPDFPPSSFDLADLHIQKVLRKPLDASEIVQALVPSTIFELDKAIEVSRRDTTAAGGVAEHDDDSMHPIEAESFLCGSVSYFDVYVRLGAKRYVKVLKAKDPFDAGRVAMYLRKGVRYFYLKKEAQVYFLQYCDKLTEAILAKPTIEPEVKRRQVLSLGRETAELLKSVGVSDASVQAANKFVEHTHKLTRTLELKSLPKLAGFIEQLKESDHCAGTTMIVAVLLDALQFRDKDVIGVIALGGFLHDVGLLMLPNGLGDRNYEDLTEDERAEFERHPTLGAEEVVKLPLVSPLVAQIVRQHHERRNRKGYPAKLGPGAIAPMAEIIGIADTFQELIARAAKDSTIDPLLHMERHQFDNFSFQTVEGFRKAFLITKK